MLLGPAAETGGRPVANCRQLGHDLAPDPLEENCERIAKPVTKRKRPSRFLSTAFIYAGNDLRSHTLGACSTIGPAGLNFRVRDGNGWIPRGKITDKS